MLTTAEILLGISITLLFVGLAGYVAFRRVARRVHRKCGCYSGRCCSDH